jgi:type II secretory pathway pseudopilin PulG
MRAPRNRGFTILEALLAMAIFLIICAAMFELLDLSQKRYSTETQLSAAYQDVRLAMDQITRDFDVSGYPPQGMFSSVPTTKPWLYAVGPVAWSPNYTSGGDCQIGVNCQTPSDQDLIIETHLSTDTADSNVSWIWYHLDTATNTLLREMVTKTAGDPYATVSTAGTAVPLLTNVMNSPGPALLAQIQTQNATMYPGGQPVPIFQYYCVSPTLGTGPTSVPCSVAGANNTPRFITDVQITLIVATPQMDIQTQRFKLVELNGRGHRLNPNS